MLEHPGRRVEIQDNLLTVEEAVHLLLQKSEPGQDLLLFGRIWILEEAAGYVG